MTLPRCWVVHLDEETHAIARAFYKKRSGLRVIGGATTLKQVVTTLLFEDMERVEAEERRLQTARPWDRRKGAF